MADARLDFEDLDYDELPDLCMKCAAPAATRIGKTFSWTPPWARFMGGIMAMAFMKRRRVSVPLCEQHKNHWSWRHMISWIPLGGLGILLAVGAVIAINGGRTLEAVGGAIAACAGACALVWLIVALVIWTTAIQPSEITDYTITLRGIHPDWVRAYHDQGRDFGRDVDAVARERFGRGRRDEPRRPRRGPADDAIERG
jgi:hypothetical protein